MVVKTEVCTFSELKIYPGKGIRYMSKDCKLPIFLSKKSTVLYLKKVRPQKIRWCTAWRRINKKLQTGEVNNKRKRRAKKIVREITGMDIETISKKKNETKEEREALRERAIREIKDRKLKAAKNNKTAKTSAPAQNKKPANKK